MLAGVVVAVGVAIVKPKTYLSETHLSAESAMSDSVGAKAKITAIESELLQRDTFVLAQATLGLKREPAELLAASSVELIPGESGRYEIVISHRAPDADEARRVVEHLSQGYQANVYERPVVESTKRARELAAKAAEVQAAFDEIDARATQFEDENADYLNAGEQELSTVRASIEQLEQQDVAQLETQISEQRRLIGEEKPFKERQYYGFDKKQATAVERKLQQAQTELRNLMDANSWPEDHPDLAPKRELVAKLEKELQAVVADKSQRTEMIPNPMYDSLKESLTSLESRLDVAKRKLGAQRKEEQRLLENARLAPDVRKRHAVLAAQREKAQDGLDAANTASAEAESSLAALKAQRALKFTTLSAPSRPDRPTGPNAAILALLGLAVGGAVGAGVAITKSGMDKSFREIEVVAPFLGVPTIGAIEAIETADEVARQASRERRRKTVLVALGLVALAGLVLALTGADTAIEGLVPGLGG